MGAREEIRLLNRQGHAPRLAETVTGLTDGWTLAWSAALTGFIGSDPAGSSSSGAPANATYVTMSLNSTLTNERYLQHGAGVTWQDGGANAALTVKMGFSGQAQGDVAYFDGSAWNNLPAGTSGNQLTTRGAGANPYWGSGTGIPATEEGQVLYSADGATFVAAMPVTTEDGWITDDDGILIVSG